MNQHLPPNERRKRELEAEMSSDIDAATMTAEQWAEKLLSAGHIECEHNGLARSTRFEISIVRPLWEMSVEENRVVLDRQPCQCCNGVGEVGGDECDECDGEG